MAFLKSVFGTQSQLQVLKFACSIAENPECSGHYAYADIVTRLHVMRGTPQRNTHSIHNKVTASPTQKMIKYALMDVL